MVTKTKYHHIFIKKQPSGSVYMTRAFRKFGMDKVVLCPVEGHTQKDAYDVLKNLEERYERPGMAVIRKLTVGELYEKYIADEEDRLRSGDITYKTFEEKRNTFKLMLLPFFKDVKIESLNYGKELWRQWRAKQTRSCLYHPKKVFRHFLNWAKNEEYLDRVIDLPIPAWDEREGRDLGWDVAMTMYECAPIGDLKDFIGLSILTGMRLNETLGLSRDRVYTDTKQILTKDYISKTKPKRIISYNEQVEEILQRRISLYSNSPWIFPNSQTVYRYRTFDGLKRQWKKLLEELNLTDVRPQDLRVTWENEARRQGVPEALRLKQAGHSKDVSDEDYMRYSALELKVVADAVRLKRGTKQGLALVPGA
jgi:integrase